MLSPFTGKEMTIQTEWRTMSYKKEDFRVCFHVWKCEDTGEQFEDEHFAQLNYEQVQHQYRAKYNIPFKEEITAIREKYDLSALKMSQILGFGDNTYRLYETGEMPSQSNARLIQLCSDAHEFRKLVDLSNAIEGATLEKLQRRIDHLLNERKNNKHKNFITEFLFGSLQPTLHNGFKKPDVDKFAQMVLFFAEQQQPWKTKLNKLLFYTDFTHFKLTGNSISGAVYKAIPMGPVPDKFQSIYEFLARQNIVDVNCTYFNDGGLGERFTPSKNSNFNPTLFTEKELTVLKSISERFKNTSTSDIIEISHKEKAWIENNENRDIIDYFYAFDLN